MQRAVNLGREALAEHRHGVCVAGVVDERAKNPLGVVLLTEEAAVHIGQQPAADPQQAQAGCHQDDGTSCRRPLSISANGCPR